MKIQDLYKHFADGVGMSDVEDGRLSLRVGDKFSPVTVTKKRLALPTTNVLRHLHDSDLIAMHPMCENITMSESPVNERLRKLIQLRLTSVFTNLSKILMSVAVDVNCHSKLNPDQTQVVTLLSNADAKLQAKWEDITDKFTMTGKDRAVNVYLKRGGKMGDKTYRRLAVMNFPIFDAVVEGRDTHTIYGVTLRKAAKDYATLEKLIDFILPEVGTNPQKYWFGSNSDTAPQFHAMANGFRNVAEQYNRVTNLFRDVMGEENYDTLYINDDWFEFVHEVDSFRDKLPILEGNAGGAGNQQQQPESPTMNNNSALTAAALVDDTPTTVTPAAAPVNNNIALPVTPVGAVTPIAQPVQQPVAQTNANGAIEWDSVGGAVRPVQQMPVMNGMYGQQQQVPPGGYAGNVPYGQQQQPNVIMPYQSPVQVNTFAQPQQMTTSATGIPGFVSPL